MTNEKEEEDPRKMWDKAFDTLRHKHETWYIFRDWLDLTLDNFTIPDQTPLFENKDKYTKEEYELFGEMFIAYTGIMRDALETRPYYVFDDGGRMCDDCDHKHSQWKLGIEKAEEVAKTIRKTMEEEG